MSRIVTFGEVMGRLAPPEFLRFGQAMPGMMEFTFGGAEANVASSLAMLGANAAFVTALPANPVADACIATLRGLGVDTSSIVRTEGGRLGLYFMELGANQRPSKVVYDRAASSVSITGADKYDWARILKGVNWFHTTGITPSLSAPAAEATLAGAAAAKKAGATVSCDLNFRAKLWRWDKSMKPKELASKTMRSILPSVDVVIANEADASDVLGIEAEGSDVESGQLVVDHYPQVAREIVRQFPNVSRVAITLRESVSASHNNWGAMLYDARTDQAHYAPLAGGQYEPYRITHIVDRVGAGDSFGAGLIFALSTPELADPAKAVAFATAASCLCHSVKGDINYATRAEVESLMGGSASGRVVR